MASIAACTSSGVAVKVPLTGGGIRIASAKLSRPHSPHPVGPASERRRCSSRSMCSMPIHIRHSTPASAAMTSSSSTSSARATMPSLRLKPIAKSSRSAGVAIITAWVSRL